MLVNCWDLWKVAGLVEWTWKRGDCLLWLLLLLFLLSLPLPFVDDVLDCLCVGRKFLLELEHGGPPSELLQGLVPPSEVDQGLISSSSGAKVTTLGFAAGVSSTLRSGKVAGKSADKGLKPGGTLGGQVETGTI